MLDIDKIKRLAKEDFEAAWEKTSQFLPKDTKINLKAKGRPHPVKEMIERSRKILLEFGFDEVENRSILPAQDVYKEYGPEAPVILDRVFYLAKLPRPEIGLGNGKIKRIKGIIGDFDKEALKKFLRAYKLGQIESDDFVEELSDRLRIPTEKASLLVEEVFDEFKNLRPIPTSQTLRSHMSATWFHTLAAVQEKYPFPVALFSIGPRYRNEQREDHSHLRIHTSASIVIMDPKMSLEGGREITSKILKRYGFEKVKFEVKKATSKYYAKGQEEEVFVRYKGKWFEIADIGMYSPIALANFGIRYPVFNAGFGIERVVMVLNKIKDIRSLVYPQFAPREFSDKEIAEAISPIDAPKTERGWTIAKAIEDTARVHKDTLSPCRFISWEDEEVCVWVVEDEKAKKLIGPAGFNEICVKDGMIYSSLSPSPVYTGFNYMKAISLGVASRIEDARENFTYQVKMVRSLHDINLEIPTIVREYIEGKQKEFKIGGPVFVKIEVKFKR
jgi:O-phosphoseryl-tRNA synthetase